MEYNNGAEWVTIPEGAIDGLTRLAYGLNAYNDNPYNTPKHVLHVSIYSDGRLDIWEDLQDADINLPPDAKLIGKLYRAPVPTYTLDGRGLGSYPPEVIRDGVREWISAKLGDDIRP